MNESLKVSIIIPAFNAASTIEKCLNSIIGQTYKEIEIIIINDGSTDSTDDICKKYALSDQRIVYKFTKNQGVSMARNLGISLASGQFIRLVDSDDYLPSDSIEKLVANFNSDIVIGGFSVFCGKKTTEHTVAKQTFALKEFKDEYFSLFKKLIVSGPWNSLYRTDIIKKANILFNEDLSYGEDTIFNLHYYSKCDELTIIPEIVYNLNRIGNDTLIKRTEGRFLSIKALDSELHNFFEGLNGRSIEMFTFNQTVHFLQLTPRKSIKSMALKVLEAFSFDNIERKHLSRYKKIFHLLLTKKKFMLLSMLIKLRNLLV